MQREKGGSGMYNDLFAEEEERFNEALAAQTPRAKGGRLAKIDENPSAPVAWELCGIKLETMPPHVGRNNRHTDEFMDLLVLMMSIAKHEENAERLEELKQIYRGALGNRMR